jgi:hypothetical protein
MSIELSPRHKSKYGQMCQVVDGSMTTLMFSLYTDLAPQTAIDPKMWCQPQQYQILLRSIRAFGTEKHRLMFFFCGLFKECIIMFGILIRC